jgi:hypothetical protein
LDIVCFEVQIRVHACHNGSILCQLLNFVLFLLISYLLVLFTSFFSLSSYLGAIYIIFHIFRVYFFCSCLQVVYISYRFDFYLWNCNHSFIFAFFHNLLAFGVIFIHLNYVAKWFCLVLCKSHKKVKREKKGVANVLEWTTDIWAKHERFGDILSPLTNFYRYKHVKLEHPLTPHKGDVKH